MARSDLASEAVWRTKQLHRICLKKSGRSFNLLSTSFKKPKQFGQFGPFGQFRPFGPFGQWSLEHLYKQAAGQEFPHLHVDPWPVNIYSHCIIGQWSLQWWTQCMSSDPMITLQWSNDQCLVIKISRVQLSHRSKKIKIMTALELHKWQVSILRKFAFICLLASMYIFELSCVMVYCVQATIFICFWYFNGNWIYSQVITAKKEVIMHVWQRILQLWFDVTVS